MKTEIKLITKRKFTVGDATSFYDAKFVENPTLGEFVQWLKKNNPEEWGKVLDKGRNQIVEYRWGGIIGYCDKYEEIKDKRIALTQMIGGWTMMDYIIEIL